MFFCSLSFLYFFCLVFGGYWVLPWQRARICLLPGASFYFSTTSPATATWHSAPPTCSPTS
jgi:hypothetical protein